MNRQKGLSSNWFLDLITLFSPDPDRMKATGTPEEMIARAARETFVVSSAAGLVPGPFGLAVMIPELLSVTRIQLTLVHRIAGHYGAGPRLDRSILLLIFGEALGLAVGKGLIRKVGSRLVVGVLEAELARVLARKIGTRIVTGAVRKGVAKSILLIAAPLFGAFSRRMTIKIGRQAEKLFSQGIVIEPGPDTPSGADKPG